MAAGFYGTNPSTSKKLLQFQYILFYLHLFPIFLLQSSTQLGQTKLFKELHYVLRETQSTFGYIVG